MVKMTAAIADYQELVDRNYETAAQLAPWSARMESVLQELEGLL